MKGACVQFVLTSPPLVAQSSVFQRLEYILIGWFFGNGTPFDSKFLNSLMGVPFTEKLRWKSKKSIQSVYEKIGNEVHKWEIGGMLTWCAGDSKVWNRCENLQLGQTIARKYGRDWEGTTPEFDVSRRGCPRVGVASELFFFPLDSHWLDFDLRRTGLIRPESGCTGHIGSYRLAIETAETDETGLEPQS